jgi:hypothetical protein
MQCFHLPKQSERNTNREGMCCAKKGGYSGLLQACATSRRVLVVVNTCNKLPDPGLSIPAYILLTEKNNKKCNNINQAINSLHK